MTERIKLSELKPGPAYGRLTNEQMARIATLRNACQDFDGRPLDDWVDSFMRDARREKEIRLWEAIADAHRRLATRYRLSPSRKRQLGKALIVATLGDKIEVDGVPYRTLESVLKNSINAYRFRTDAIAFTELRGVDTLKTTIRPLAFESQELFDAYLNLVERFPEWAPTEDAPTESGTNLCIAVYDDYPEIIPMAFEAPEENDE